MSFGGGGGGSSRISTSSDVILNNPTDGQVLSYNGSLTKWQNANASTTLTNLKAVCVYNGSAYPARPSGYGSVEWIGPVDPGASAQNNDTWVNTA